MGLSRNPGEESGDHPATGSLSRRRDHGSADYRGNGRGVLLRSGAAQSAGHISLAGAFN